MQNWTLQLTDPIVAKILTLCGKHLLEETIDVYTVVREQCAKQNQDHFNLIEKWKGDSVKLAELTKKLEEEKKEADDNAAVKRAAMSVTNGKDKQEGK